MATRQIFDQKNTQDIYCKNIHLKEGIIFGSGKAFDGYTCMDLAVTIGGMGSAVEGKQWIGKICKVGKVVTLCMDKITVTPVSETFHLKIVEPLEQKFALPSNYDLVVPIYVDALECAFVNNSPDGTEWVIQSTTTPFKVGQEYTIKAFTVTWIM